MIPPNKSELKPCPFCGGTNIAIRATLLNDFTYGCKDCCIEGPAALVPDAAIAVWNSRADGWIKVEDRLPETDSNVLVPLDRSSWVAYYAKDKCWYSSLDEMEEDAAEALINRPLFWQPLPNPPEVGR